MRLPLAFSLCIAVAAMTGCAGLGSPKPDLKTELSKTGVPTAEANTAKIDVLFQPEGGKPERLERALTEATTVQQMLVQTGGIKKFRRIEVKVIRPLQQGGYHEIPCEFDRETKSINPERDIALMPGDKLIVKEDTSTIVDDMMRSMGGNLGQRFISGGKHKAASKYRFEG